MSKLTITTEGETQVVATRRFAASPRQCTGRIPIRR
jgi:hypothetical protein